MTPERWKRVEKLYHSVLAREPAERTAFLQEACADDEALRQEVESLLAQQTEAENFIEAPALEVEAKGRAKDQAESTVVIRSRSPSHSLVGQTISHYRILEKLGEGGMGVVYKAQDLRLERLVALKFLPHHLTPEEDEKVRFIREAKAASALDHPNIGTIYEIAETEDGQMFIVMAYYEGKTLKKKIECGSLPVKEAVDIAAQIALGLAKAHSQQIVHRDVKPGNILVTPEGVVKIIDFGLAKLGGVTKITQTGTTVGTVAYISPEQARGEEVDRRTDVWSLGVVLYEMLTGQLPFPGDHVEAVLHSILTGKPKPLRQLCGDVPIEVERIIHRALEKDLKSRYASAAEVLKDLNEYHSRLTLPEMRLGGWKLLSGWVRQKRVAIPGLLILLVLGSLLGWLFHRQAKVRWARDEALPEISRLIDEEKYMAAFALAQKAERYIPNDLKLNKLLSSMTHVVSIRTMPPQAKIYFKEYSAAGGQWTYLGQSPLENVKSPWGGFRFKVEKDGFNTLETVEDPGFVVVLGSNAISFSLEPIGSSLPSMVRVSAWRSPFAPNIPGYEALEPVELPDYWMDKYEVTNKEFKRFVDAGGYEKRQFWKYPFLREAHELSWEEAMSKLRDRTGRAGPSTWELGSFPEGQDDYPVSGVSWYEAAAYAQFVGKNLPTIYHWNNAAMTVMSSYIAPLSNFGSKGPARVGSYRGISRSGTYDMAGNVKEWCWNETNQGRRYILGGAWDEPGYMFNDADAQSPFDRHSNFGFRCVKYSPQQILSKSVTGPIPPPVRSYGREKPVSDEIFRAYQSMFSYDRKELDQVIESVDETGEYWKQETITFTPAHGGERALALLFLPKRFAPPYQTVVYMAWGEHIIDDYQMRVVDFIIKSGRAVLCPMCSSISPKRTIPIRLVFTETM